MAEDALRQYKSAVPVGQGAGKKSDNTIIYILLGIGVLGLLLIAAVIIIPILVGMYFYTGGGTVSNVTPSSCTFPPGLTCASYMLHTDGSLDLRVGQALGHPIRVDEIACAPIENISPSYTPVGVEVGIGEQEVVSGAGAPATVYCGNGGQPGEFYKGKIWIKYTEQDTLLERVVVGDIAAKYEQ